MKVEKLTTMDPSFLIDDRYEVSLMYNHGHYLMVEDMKERSYMVHYPKTRETKIITPEEYNEAMNYEYPKKSYGETK